MKIYKNLLNNTFIFAIGDLSTKGITLLLVPIFSFYLTKSEFGSLDLIQTSILLIIPVLSLSAAEAVLRFTFEFSPKKVFTNGLTVILLGLLLTNFITFLIYLTTSFEAKILFLISLLVCVMILQNLLLQFSRGLKKNFVFAVSSIISSVSLLLFIFVFIFYSEFSLEKYLLSAILSNFTSIIFIYYSLKINKYIDFNEFDHKFIKELLKYSCPMIPNSIIWWVINGSSRFLILYFLGPSANGVYAVSSKIPGLINIFNSIFFKAWQIVSIEDLSSNSKDEDMTKKKVFIYFRVFLLMMITILILFIDNIFKIFINITFFEAVNYVPILLFSIYFSSCSSFLGTNYIVNKKTGNLFKSTIWSAVINIFLNVILIPYVGLYGVAISSMISFFYMYISRIIDLHKNFFYYVNSKVIIHVILVTITYFNFLYTSPYYLLNKFVIFIVLVLLNTKLIYKIFRILLSFVLKKTRWMV